MKPALTICIALVCGSALAGPVTFLDLPPWHEGAVAVSVDQAQLHGELDPTDLADLIAAGESLFAARFTTQDGAGRPLATQATIPTHFKHARELLFQRASGPDANACTGCHNAPLAGGAGDFVGNAFTSEGTESADFDNVDPQFSNERNTNHLFGSGLVELLAREMTVDLQAIRRETLVAARDSGEVVTSALTTKGILFGQITAKPDGTLDTSEVDGVDDDLVVRPFSQKGVIPSLRMFSVNAMNAHHGMQAEERFGPHMTGEPDFDGDGVEHELGLGEISAIVAYQAALAPPIPSQFENEAWNLLSAEGQHIFTQVGCAACHVPSLPLASLKFADPGPNDTAGTLSSADVAEPAIYDFATLSWAQTLEKDADGNWLVPLFGDLKRHQISDNQTPALGNELMGQAFVGRDTFITAELWGVADTDPYGHRGDLTTLAEVIEAHGGDARESRVAYQGLSRDEQNAVLTFLNSLKMPQ